MLGKVARAVLRMIPQHTAYRLGRKMYLQARGDIANDMSSNGELMVQRCVIAATRAAGEATVFDVGANIGDWTTALLAERQAQGANAQLFSFEPVPSTAQTLRDRLSAKHLGVHVEEMALSSAPGTAEIFVIRDNGGTNSLHRDRQAPSRSIQVKLESATHFCEERGIQHVHLLKCDTEGHDMEVIRGALPMLQEGRISVLQFEYNHRWVFSRNFLRDAFTAVNGLPYLVAKLQPDALLLIDEWHPELEKFFEGNYVLVHRDALSWFKTSRVAFDASNAPTRPTGPVRFQPPCTEAP